MCRVKARYSKKGVRTDPDAPLGQLAAIIVIRSALNSMNEGFDQNVIRRGV